MSPIPWASLLRHGPTLVATATRLLATANESKLRQQNETFEQRVAQLEHTSAESARLIQEMAQQVQGLTAAQEHTARRVRLTLALAVIALLLGVAAGILAIVR